MYMYVQTHVCVYKHVSVFKCAPTYQIDHQVVFETCIWLARSDGTCL